MLFCEIIYFNEFMAQNGEQNCCILTFCLCDYQVGIALLLLINCRSSARLVHWALRPIFFEVLLALKIRSCNNRNYDI